MSILVSSYFIHKKNYGKIVYKKGMEDVGLHKNQMDEIDLVGGSTRIPKVRHLLKDYFEGKKPNKGVNPDEELHMVMQCKEAF